MEATNRSGFASAFDDVHPKAAERGFLVFRFHVLAGLQHARSDKSLLLHRGRSHIVTHRGRTMPPAVLELLRMIIGSMK